MFDKAYLKKENFGLVDELYKDPANTYIDWCLICLVACKKLKGEDVRTIIKRL